MSVRRPFFIWQLVAALVLPVWLLVGYALRGDSVGGLLGVVLLAPLVLAVEVGLALLFSARARVRGRRAPDLLAVGVLAAYQVGVLGFGFFGSASAWFGVLAVVAAVGGSWLGGALLARDVRSRVRATAAAFQRPAEAPRTPIDAGEYVVVRPATR